MKKILFLLLSVLVLTGCKSKEERAEEAVRKEIVKFIVNPDTYKPISSEIEEAYEGLYNIPSALGGIRKILNYQKEISELQDKLTISIINTSAQGLSTEDMEWDIGGKLKDLPQKDYLQLLASNINKLKRQIESEKRSILLLRPLNPQKIGYNVLHKFQITTDKGEKEIIEMYLLFDDKFQELKFFQICDTEYWDVINYIYQNFYN